MQSRKLSAGKIAGATFCLTLSAMSAKAELLSSTDPTIRNNLCVGSDCADVETGFSPAYDEVRMKGPELRIIFEDTSTEAGFASADWSIEANEPSDVGQDLFLIKNITDRSIPFTILGGAPSNSIFVANDGDIGLGTSVPQADVHIENDSYASLRLNQNGTGGTDPGSFELGVDDTALTFLDVTNTTVPFSIELASIEDSLSIQEGGVVMNGTGTAGFSFDIEGSTIDSLLFVDAASGRVGIGTSDPQEALHILRDAPDTDSFALFEASGPGSDSAFRIRQNGLVPTTWEFRNQQDSGRLNVGIAGGNTPFKIDNAANNNLLRLGRNGQPGEVSITGTLVVNNTALNVPDYVFADDYALRPLAEVRDFITANSHLPDVPSEAEIKANGVDMTAMQMTLLKKVEELTLYTLALEKARAAQAQEIAELRRMVTANPD